MPYSLLSNYPKRHYGEVPQSVPLLFAFAEVEGEVVKCLHQPIKCRDFLLDTLLWNAKVVKFERPIYGYDFQGPVKKNTMALFNVLAPENVEKLHDLEKKKDMGLSKLTQIDGKTYLIEGDDKWLSNTVLLSYWTFLIRCFLGGKDVSFKDEMSKMSYGKWKLSPEELHEKLLGVVVSTNVMPLKRLGDTVHGPMGIISYLNSPNSYEFKQ